MNNLGGIFDKYIKLLDSLSKQKVIIKEVITQIAGCEINESDIKIKKNIVYIKTNQSNKALIFIAKTKILQSLTEKLENFLVIDIR
ncbi:MAG: hypothetical protein A2571_00755 [Candidatus Vogelbacteria bacterium RIFOXYD1_FULL_44_32]|uniref:Uncharacterized protein n=1 Tax=Candidatus Vogelbacteria bacterium RIFOXYD1_FULL_44_32 TaxID=1802438 RepID=A0A1G2QEI9_9BACT|nr:MAG: hypothetical protein A2571_00755 [Candidatus Vogelbacteria bacterium RIFOXYD1_FULL_44_32]